MFWSTLAAVATAIAAFELPVAAGSSIAALGAPIVGNSTAVTWTPSTSEQTTCDVPTFAEDDGLAAANWRDCAAMYSVFTSESGVFTSQSDVSIKEFTPLLKYNQCTLSVMPVVSENKTFEIGDVDVEVILRGALQDFSQGTLLSAKGQISCGGSSGNDTGAKSNLQWRIYDADVVETK